MEFSAVLLAGGRSSRMGRDKASLEIEGVPLWKRQLRLINELGPHEAFLSGRRGSEWPGVEVIADSRDDAGPLAGITAALRRCTTAHLLVLAVDLPNLTAAFLRDLLSSCNPESGVVPSHAIGFEPLAAVYPRVALQIAETCLAAQTYSLQQFVARAVAAGLITLRPIAHVEEPLFLNLNTPQDFAAATDPAFA